MELWDIYNEKKEITGKVVERDNYDFLENEYHLVVIIWVMNLNGEFLVQRRSFTKDLYPGVLATHGGSVLKGESSIEGAIRETVEEVGVLVNADDLVLFDTKFSGTAVYDHYFVKMDVSMDDVVVDPVEVDSALFLSLEEIERMTLSGEFFEYGKHHFEDYYSSLKGVMNK